MKFFFDALIKGPRDDKQKQLRAIDSIFVARESLKCIAADLDEKNIHKMYAHFLRSVKIDNLEVSFIDYYKNIENKQMLEMNF